MSLPEIDTLVFFLINRDLQNSLFDLSMPFITTKAYLIFLPFFLWLFVKNRKHALTVFMLACASILIADWASNTLKHYFERVRPCHVFDTVKLLVGCGKSFSMPSNHAANAFAFAAPFYILFKNRIRYAFIAAAFLVCFSRVYVGVHYPSDVIAGALLGMFLALSVVQLYKWSSKRYKEKPYTTVLFIFLLVISLFRIYYIQHGPLDLSPDEAHYWEWSRRLDLSYYSKGPMIAYLIHLGTSLFGDTVFGVRVMAVIFSALSSVLLYRLGKDLYDESAGVSAATLMQMIPLFSPYGILFTIDSPLIFFWILSLFLFWKAINRKALSVMRNEFEENEINPSHITDHSSLIYWSLLGLSIGLGLLTKYTMAFFYPCAFLFLLASKGQKRLLLTKGPYIASVISLIVFSPVIVWNANHDWVTFKHTAGQAHIEEGLRISLRSFFEFSGSQFLVITPLLLVLIGVSIWKLKKDRNGAFLFWFSVPVIAFFLLKSMHAKVQANWALPGYITGIIAFSTLYLRNLIPPHPPLEKRGFDTLEKEAKEDFQRNHFYYGGKGKQILVATAVAISLTVTAVAHYPSILNLPVKQDPTSRLRGWKELGEEVTMIHRQMSANRPVFIFSDRYQVSSELAFYVKGHPVTYCVNLGRRMNQYDLWPGFNNLMHHDAIFVRKGDSRMPHEVSAVFKRVEKRVFTVYTKKHTKIRDYSLFMCYDFVGLKKEKPDRY